MSGTVTQARVLRAEWTKLRTLPSTAWSFLAAVVLTIGVGAAYSLLRVARPPAESGTDATSDPIAVSMLPGDWSEHIYRYLPAPAGTAVTFARPDDALLGPWTGFGLFCLYAAVVLGLAAWRLRARDV